MEKINLGPGHPLPVSPLAVIGTYVNGKANYAAAGFVSGANWHPPIVMVSLNHHHHSVKGIRENGAFSLNIPTHELLIPSDYAGLVSGKETDKSALFTPFEGETGKTPLIKECPLSAECRVVGKEVPFGQDIVFFAEVTALFADKDALDEAGRPDISRLAPLLIGTDHLYRIPGEVQGEAYKAGWDYLKEESSFPWTIEEKGPRRAVLYPLARQEDWGSAMAALFQAVPAPLGPPFALRQSSGFTELGLPSGDVSVNPPLKAGEVPAGLYASRIYRGPYEGLRKAEAELAKAVKGRGKEPHGRICYVYLNDPGKTPPEKLETQILMALKE